MSVQFLSEPLDLPRLHVEFHQTRDPRIREQLIRAHMNLAGTLARQYQHRGQPLEDLVQVACYALIKSVDRFDPGRGFKFSTFARVTIVGELKRHFRDKQWALRVARRHQELHLRVRSTTDALTTELGRSPTVHEIARASGLSDEEVLLAFEVNTAFAALSLDAPLTGRDGEQGHLDIGEGDSRFGDVEDQVLLAPLIAGLSARDARIVHLRFVEGLTQSEIGAMIGVSQMQVSRILTRLLHDFRERLDLSA